MKTDYLDVVQFHSSPSRQTLEEHGALEALLELKRPARFGTSACPAHCPI
jgi:hypothetical protein